MYYKKFSDKEMRLIRQAIQELGQNFSTIIEDGEDEWEEIKDWKKDLKTLEKIEKKLVHCFYLVRGNK
tara:strand:+ start:57 stop:260 length:204 start_codon:yes stop_codon:yes gene_type:complete